MTRTAAPACLPPPTRTGRWLRVPPGLGPAVQAGARAHGPQHWHCLGRPGRALATAAALALAGCSALPPAAPGAAAGAGPAATLPDLSPVPMRPPAWVPPAGWQQGAMMEIFVRGYVDSDGDGIGDLRGLTSRLDHLQQLGIKSLWLMPVTANADGDHGYATTDHRAIAPEFGTLADFDALIAAAHARGIAVVMDYVINHAAAEHALFRAARSDAASPWRPWFVWADAPPQGWDIWGKNPWYHTASQPWLHTGEPQDLPKPPAGARGFYFGTFGPHMPDFDFRHPAVRAYHDSSLRFWLNRGLDGFRLDAVPHLVETNAVDWNDQPESRAITAGLRALVHAYPGRITLCEATAKPLEYAAPGLCGASFAFGLEQPLVRAARGEPAGVRAVADYIATMPGTLGVFVSNHDKFAGRRLMDQVADDEMAYRLAAGLYLLLPGTPVIYYGEEIGQAGAAGLSGDPEIRGPMSWSATPAGFSHGQPYRPPARNIATHNLAAQQADPGSLLAHYRALLALRNGHAALSQGTLAVVRAEGASLSFQRSVPGEQLVLAYNLGTTPATLALTTLPADARLQPLFAHPAAAATPLATRLDGSASATLPPRSMAVWRVQR